MKVLGVDIGARNLSLCTLELDFVRDKRRGSALARAREALKDARVSWRVEDICPGAKNANRCAQATLLNGLVAFCEGEGAALLDEATHVVIEAQPAARMKMLAAALYALARRRPGTRVITFQAARRKLSVWGRELTTYLPEVRQGTYAERKRGAVALMLRLLRDAGHEERAEELERLRKKDDAADSFLHALAYAVG